MDAELIVRLAHYTGFTGCLVASFWKNAILRSDAVEGQSLARLLVLDRVSGASALIILMSGLTLSLWIAKPTTVYASNWAYWLKVGLFAAASGAVVATKPIVRRAATAGILKPTIFTRALLLFDFASILTVAAIGRTIARGAIL